VIDAGGVIRHTQVGFTSGDEKKYVAVLESLLGAPGCESQPSSGKGWPGDSRPTGERQVQRLLFHTSSGTDAAHRAVLPFVFAVKAKEKGHDPIVFLAGDATLLMKDGVLAAVRAPGQPDAASLVRRAADLRIPIFL